MCCVKVKFGVAMLALVGLIAAASPAQAALVLYDDFNDAAMSATLWDESRMVQDAPVTAVFDGATATLTMDALGEVALIDSDIAMQLDNVGDTFRMTFDMTPTLDRFAFLGARIGVDYEASDLEWVAGVRHNDRGVNRSYTPDLQQDGAGSEIVSGSPYHFDLTAVMTAAGLADYALNIYNRDPDNDTDPDLYPTVGAVGTDPGTLVNTFTLGGTVVTPGQNNIIGLFVGFANGTANTSGQNRGTAGRRRHTRARFVGSVGPRAARRGFRSSPAKLIRLEIGSME